jgi:putative PIN family toxin of toxin-antitoxin system
VKVVADTNVLVSAIINPYGPPGEIVGMALLGSIEICFDARILREYEETLLDPRFGFAPTDIRALLEALESSGHPTIPEPLARPLPDRDDEPFLEVARAAGAAFLITGNLKHYPPERRQGMTVVSPREFLDCFRG